MRRRSRTGVLLAVIATLALTMTTAAGGWATVEMDKPVTRFEVDRPLTMEFMLLQHGNKPADWTTTYLEASNAETGETLRVDAEADTEAGRWSVTVTFPSAGTWDWAIQTEELVVEDSFPALEVVGNAAVAGNTSGVTPAERDVAITGATEALTKQLSSVSGEIDLLQKEVATLTGERDMLQKQIGNLEAAQADQPGTTGTAWWLSVLAGALAALAVVAASGLFAIRRGLIRAREKSPATA